MAARTEAAESEAGRPVGRRLLMVVVVTVTLMLVWVAWAVPTDSPVWVEGVSVLR